MCCPLSTRSLILQLTVNCHLQLHYGVQVFCWGVGFSSLSLHGRLWLDEHHFHCQLSDYFLQKKIRLKGIWREVRQLISLPNPWRLLSNSSNSWWKFTVIPPISATSGILWKPFYFFCGLCDSFNFAWKKGQGKGRRLLFCLKLLGHIRVSPRPRNSVSCRQKHFGQCFRSSSEKDLTLSQVIYSSASSCLKNTSSYPSLNLGYLKLSLWDLTSYLQQVSDHNLLSFWWSLWSSLSII